MVVPSESRGIAKRNLKGISTGSLDRLGMTLLLIQHRCGEFQRFITLSAQHSCNLFAPRFAANLTQLSKGATISHFFRYHELGSRRRGHRREMGDAEHLMALCQLPHARADGV